MLLTFKKLSLPPGGPLSEYLTFECLTCRKRFAGTHKTVLGINACPKCNSEGAWWSLVNRNGGGPHAVSAPSTREIQPPLQERISSVGFKAPSYPGTPTTQPVRHPLSAPLVIAAISSVLTLLVVSIVGALVFGRSTPAENTPVQSNAPQLQASPVVDYPQKKRDDSFKAFYRSSSRVSAQMLRLSDALKLNDLAAISDEVTILSREFDALTFSISDEQRNCTYTLEMDKAISLFKTGVENWKLALKFQDQAENGRFSMSEREELMKHALDCVNSRADCFRLGGEAALTASKAWVQDMKEIDERQRTGG